MLVVGRHDTLILQKTAFTIDAIPLQNGIEGIKKRIIMYIFALLFSQLRMIITFIEDLDYGAA